MIVVTAPTSKIGRQILPALLAHGAPVRVIVRDSASLPTELMGRVEVVTGSHADATVVKRAFDGAEAVFWLAPANPHADSILEAFVDFTRPAANALLTCGVRRVVGISALGRHTPQAAKAGYVTGSLAMDDLIASTGVHFRALTLPSFMDNILRQTTTIKNQGLFFSPIDGDLKLPSCATHDIASVAARQLLNTEWTGQEEVAALGPENISFNDMAAVMSEVLGKPVRFQQISLDAYKAGLLRAGFSEAMAQGMTDMARAKSLGLDLGVKRSPENTTPTRFRAWCEAALLPALTD